MRLMNQQSRMPKPHPTLNAKVVSMFLPEAASVDALDIVVTSVDPATNRITAPGHGFNQKGSLAAGGFTPVWFENDSASAPTGLSLNTMYGLHSVSGNTFIVYPLINAERNSRLPFDNAAFEVNPVDITGSTWTGTLRLRTRPQVFKNGDIGNRGNYSFTAGDRNERAEIMYLEGQPCFYMDGFYYNGDVATSLGASSFNAAIVNPATDTITTGATHSYVTGQGVFLQKLTIGATYPAGLSMALGTPENPEPYFVRSTGTNTLQLYNTRANALAGGATGLIDITAIGSGNIEIQQVGQAVGKHITPTISDTRFSNNANFGGRAVVASLAIGRENFQVMTENDQKRRAFRFFWSAGQVLSGGFSTSAQTALPIGFTQNVTNVDTVNNRITFNGHGLTQSAKVRASYPDGATQMGSVVAGTDYFVRFINENVFELYDTRANAEGAGTTGRMALGALGSGVCVLTTIDNGNGTRFLAGNTTRTIIGTTTGVEATMTPAYITNQATAISGTVITLTGHGFASTGFPACASIDGTGTLPTGLTAGVTYWIRRINSTQFSVHPTLADANANTNAISMTAGTGTLVFTTGSFSINPHTFTQGLPVRLIPRAGSLPAPFNSSTTYFVRVTSIQRFQLHATLADAHSNTNPIVPQGFGTSNTIAIIPAEPGFALGDDNVGFRRYRNRNLGAMYFQAESAVTSPYIKTSYGYGVLETNSGGSGALNTFPATGMTFSLFNSADGDTPSGGYYRCLMSFNDQLRGGELNAFLDWFYEHGMLSDGGGY